MIINTDDITTMGDLAEVLKVLRTEQGWTKGSAAYVLDKVWWEEDWDADVQIAYGRND